MRKHIIVISLLSTLFFMFATCLTCYAQGEAVYGCAKKKGGYLRIVTDPTLCKSNETSVTMNQGGTDTGGIKVYDASGQYLGIFQDLGDGLTIYSPSLKKNIALNSYELSGTDVSSDCVYYSNNNCSGQTYGEYYGGDSSLSIYKGYGKYYIEDGSPLGAFDYLSQSCGNDCSTYSGKTFGLRLKEVTLPFQTPINLPLRFDSPVTPPLPRLTIDPPYANILDPDIGSQATFTINGGTPPFSVYPRNAQILAATISGHSVTVQVLNLYNWAYYYPQDILLTDSAGVSAFAQLSYSVTPIQISPLTQTITNPSVGSTATFTITGGYKTGYTLYNCNTSYTSCSLSGSTVTVNVTLVPYSDQTINIGISQPGGTGGANVELILDVPEPQQ